MFPVVNFLSYVVTEVVLFLVFNCYNNNNNNNMLAYKAPVCQKTSEAPAE